MTAMSTECDFSSITRQLCNEPGVREEGEGINGREREGGGEREGLAG